MEQQNLFTPTLSDHTKLNISLSLNALVAWGTKENQPHIKAAVVEYFNQLKSLLENAEHEHIRHVQNDD